MYITKITVENFQSYYKKNTISLEKNLNLLLGTIGAGKSKLFNAIYWNFYSEIYKTENGWNSVNSSNFLSIFNKLSLKEINKGETLTVKVELLISSETNYIVTHSIHIKKTRDNDFCSESSWDFLNEELIVSFDNPEGNRINIDNYHEARDYINKKLLPKEISRYIWFQGETLNELIDISKGKTFKDAVNFISYMGYYDNNISIVDAVIDKIDKALRKERKSDTTNEREFNRLTSEIEGFERKIPIQKESLINLTHELENVERVIEDIGKRLDDINEYTSLKSKKETLETKRRFILEEIENFDKNRSNLFSKYWLLLNTKPLLERGYDKLHTYQKWYEKNQNENPTGLPYNIPDPKYLQEMLDRRTCYICGEKFEENSNAFKTIEERLKLSKGELETSKQKNREQLAIYNKVVDTLANKTSIINKADSVKSDIVENIRYYNDLNNKKGEIIEAIKKIIDEITQLQQKHGNKMIDNFSIEKNKYNYNINERDSLKERIRRTNDSIGTLNRELQKKKDDLNKIPTKSKKEYKEEKILKYLSKLKDAYQETKELEFEKLIKTIEKKANEILYKITAANNVINGKIVIDRDTYLIKLVDLDNSNGDRDVNTGHITLMKMCIINAMVLISNKYKNKSYPFITDAPTSDLDDGTTKLYYKVLNEEFEQSIVMTKDLFTYKEGKNVVDKESLKDFNFHNVHLINKEGAMEELTETNSYSAIKRII
jgi:DNA repair exonuclease SbcCD ATPase subunit